MDQNTNSIWMRLTEPSASIVEQEQRHQVRLLVIMLLLLWPLGLMAAIIQTIAEFPRSFWQDPEFRQMLGFIPFMIAMYVLSRTRYYKAVIWMVIVASSLVIFMMALPEHLDDDFDIALYYLIIPVLLCGLFLPLKAGILVTAVNAMGVLLFHHVIPNSDPAYFVIGPFVFLLVTASATLMGMYYRNHIESYRRQKLAASHARLHAIFDNMAVGIAVTDQDGRILQVNDHWVDLLGYNASDLAERTFLDITHPDDVDISLTAFTDLKSGQIPARRFEKRYLCKNGRILFADISVTPIKSLSHGIEAFIALIVDATERKEAEGERERLLQKFETIVNLSAALRQVDTISDTVRVVLQHMVDVTNASFGGLFTFEDDSQTLTLRASYPQLPTQSFFRHQVTWPTGQVFSQHNNTVVILRTGVDPLFPIICQKLALPPETQAILSIALNARDLTVGVLCLGTSQVDTFQQRQSRLLMGMAEVAATTLQRAMVLETLEEQVAARTHELAAANDQLRHLDRLKSKFIDDISHELRTPLTNLNLYLTLLEQGSEEKRPYYIQVLRGRVHQLTRLSEEILLVNKLDEPQEQAAQTAVNLNDVAAQVVESFRSHASDAGLALFLSTTADLPPVLGVEGQLKRTVSNLVKNSLDYTRQGSIMVKTYVQNNMLCLMVEDTGMGIDADDKPYIFDRFYRGYGVGQFNKPGTGLGLSIAKQIMELHGGRIEVQSEPEGPTRFILCFPCMTKPA